MRYDVLIVTAMAVFCSSACDSEAPATSSDPREVSDPNTRGSNASPAVLVTSTPAAPPAATVPSAPPPTASAPSAPPPSQAPVASLACTELRPCCSALLDSRDRALCQGIAEEQTDALCKLASDDYCQMPSTTQTTDTTDCVTLDRCCATLEDEDDQDDCQAIADSAVTAECRASLPELCPEATTPATGMPATGVCAMLDATCCATLEDDEDIEDCREAVSDADAAACQEALDSLCGTAEGDDD